VCKVDVEDDAFVLLEKELFHVVCDDVCHRPFIPVIARCLLSLKFGR
jgi:hypothetical protein